VAQGKDADRLEREDDAFHRRVAEAFRAAAGGNVVHVNANGAREATHAAVWSAVTTRFPELGP
jgi:thymidylate kinase